MVIKDRLEELRRKANIPEVGQFTGDYSANNFKGRGATTSCTSREGLLLIEMHELDGELSNTLTQVEDLKGMIGDLRSTIDEIERLHNILRTTVPNKREKAELIELMRVCYTREQVIMTRLKDMANINSEPEDEEIGSVLNRIRATQLSLLWREFFIVFRQFQLANTEYKDTCRVWIKHQFEIADSAASGGNVERIIEVGGDSQMLTQGMISQTAQAKQMLEDIQERHENILKLERSLVELHDMYTELNIIVECQGEIVETTGDEVKLIQEQVKSGLEDLKQWRALQAKSKNKKKWIIVILILIMLAIILILLILRGHH